MKKNYAYVMMYLVNYAAANLMWAQTDPKFGGAIKNVKDRSDEERDQDFDDMLKTVSSVRLTDFDADELDLIEFMMEAECDFDIDIEDAWGGLGDDPTFEEMTQYILAKL